MEKKRIIYPIIVEGKYDKIKLDSIFDAKIFVSDGFGVFKSKEKQRLLKKIAEGGVILLLDSDGGGTQIRSYLNSIIPKDKIHNIYIPRVEGKERRKLHASKSGTLGVEGMEREVLERALAPFTVCESRETGEFDKKPRESREMITKLDFYTDGLSGGVNSSELRDRLCERFGLPCGMSANSLLEALNLICDREEYKSIMIEMKTIG